MQKGLGFTAQPFFFSENTCKQNIVIGTTR
jgi:hypothetical protein